MKFASFLDAVAHHAEHQPESTCIIELETDATLTYASFFKQIRCFARVLLDAGLKEGERVILLREQTARFIIAQYAVYLCGGVSVPVDNDIREKRLGEIVSNLDVRFTISSKPIELPNVKNLAFDAVLADCELPSSSEYTGLPPDRLCDIRFTSGSTGRPKAVMLSHKNQCAAAYNAQNALQINADDIFATPLPVHHVSGARCPGAVFLAGATLIITGKILLAGSIATLSKRYGATIFWCAPAHIQILLSSGVFNEKVLPTLRAIATSTSPLSEEQKTQLCELFPKAQLIATYGTSEAGICCSLDYRKHPGRPLCMGQSNINAQIVFVDDEGQIMEATRRNPGRIAVKGDVVALGYWNEPELSAKSFKDGLYITTDLGFRDSDGLLFWAGRNDEVINIGGQKVAPEEIESAMRLFPGLIDCACVPLPDSILGQTPKLFVVLSDKNIFDPVRIMTFLTKHLEPFKIPKSIECLDNIPRNDIGKVNRRSLLND